MNWTLLLASLVGIALFAHVESRAVSPLIQVALLYHPLLRSRLAMSGLVSTVVMATLVVGLFYLSGALELAAARIGLVMSAGPLVAARYFRPEGEQKVRNPDEQERF